jgi:hypothetical protein
VAFIAAGLIVVGGGAAGVYYATSGGRAAEPVAQAPVETQTQAAPPAVVEPTPTPVDTTPPPAESRPPQVTPAPPTTGTVVIQAMPSGGTVTVDGRVQSGTRLELSPGRHDVRIVHPNYEQYSERVQVRAGQLATVRFAGRPIVQQQAPVTQPPVQQPPAPTRPVGLLEGQGILRISVNVAAEIYVQGALKGRGRAVDTLLAGAYQIRIVGPSGYRDSTFYQQVAAGAAGTLVRIELMRQ